MPTLKKQGLKILKMGHLLFVVLWIGGAIATAGTTAFCSGYFCAETLGK